MTPRHESSPTTPSSTVSSRKRRTKVPTRVTACPRVLPWSSHSLQEPPLVHLQAQVDLLARATAEGRGRTPRTSIDTAVGTSLLLCKPWTVKHTAHRFGSSFPLPSVGQPPKLPPRSPWRTTRFRKPPSMSTLSNRTHYTITTATAPTTTTITTTTTTTMDSKPWAAGPGRESTILQQTAPPPRILWRWATVTTP